MCHRGPRRYKLLMKTTTLKQIAIFVWLIFLLAFVSCQSTSSLVPPASGAASPTTTIAALSPIPTVALSTPTTVVTATPTVVSSTPVPPSTPDETNTVREVTVLYTNDEHGWMEGMDRDNGAANLLSLWREVEGYTEDGPFLILSGGDMWTGPAISTWFEGESMVEVMNALGYDAAAVGNHEFDFGLEALRRRANEAAFPILSANTRYRANGQAITNLGVMPYTIIEVNGLKIGLIGLTTTSTPQTTNPVNVTELQFIAYETALRQIVPEVKAANVDLIFVPGHVCLHELELLAEAIDDLGIAMLGGGHCNELVAQEVNGIVILEGGFHLTAYARATFRYDTAADELMGVDYGVGFNEGGMADLGIDTIITRWQAEAENELNLVIGYTDQEIPHRSQALQAMVVKAWLAGYPSADVAITNLGGLRAPIPPGEITLGDIVGVMPFDNTIIEVQLTGAQLMKVIVAGGRPVIGGMTQKGGSWTLDKTGRPVDPEARYSVLVNSFMYAGGDNYGLLAEFDPAGYDTGIHYRQPLIDWLVAQGSSPDKPLVVTN